MDRNSRKRQLIQKFTLSYLILLVIPIIMGMMTFIFTFRLLLQHTLDNNVQNLAASSALVDDAYAAMEKTIYSISSNTNLMSCLYSEKGCDDIDLLRTAQTFPQLSSTNSFIDRYFLYYHGNDCEFVIGPRLFFRKLPVYYPSFFRYNDLTNDEFWAMLCSNPQKRIYHAADIVYNNCPQREILISFPYLSKSAVIDGHFLFYINIDRMFDLFTTHTDNIAWIGAYDQEGQLLASRGDSALNQPLLNRNTCRGISGTFSVDYSDSRYFLQYHTTDSGLLFVTLNSTRTILVQVAPVLYIVGGCICAFLALAAFLSYRFTHNNQRPLIQLLNALPLDSERKKGLWPIKASVDALLVHHEELNAMLHNSRVQLRDAVISQLVKGNFGNVNNLRILLEHTGIDIVESQEYRGVYLKILSQSPLSESTMPQLEIRHSVLFRALQTFEPALQLLTLRDEKTCILLYSQTDSGCPLEALMAKVYQSLSLVCAIDIVLYVGVACENLYSLKQSFASAQSMMANEAEGEKYLYIAQPNFINTTYDYTTQDETELLTAVQRNDLDKIKTILESVYNRNYHQQELSGFMQQSLYCAMLHTLHRTEYKMVLPTKLTNIPLQLTKEEFFEALFQLYERTCLWLQENRRRDSKLTLDNVLRFINEHFTDANMSLTYVAVQFGLTDKYLSDGFKRMAQINFSTFLEQKRITHAQELLETTQMSVEQISEAVGYTSVRTFRRAYKRVSGHSPRDDHAQMDAEMNET